MTHFFASTDEVRFQYYYMRNEVPIELLQKHALHEDHKEERKHEEEEKEDNVKMSLKEEKNPTIASALVSSDLQQWKQCHMDLRNILLNEANGDLIVDKFWTLENVFMSSNENNRIANSVLALELSHSFASTSEFMRGRQDTSISMDLRNVLLNEANGDLIVDKFWTPENVFMSSNENNRIVNSVLAALELSHSFASTSEFMRGRQDTSISPYSNEAIQYNQLVTEINNLRREALKRVYDTITATIDGNEDGKKESELLKVLTDDKLLGTPTSYTVLKYLFWILNDCIITSSVEVKKWACCIISKCLASDDSFHLLRDALKKNGISSCKVALLYLNLRPKDGFPPLDTIIEFIEKHSNPMEELGDEIQKKIPKMKENINSSDPNALKEAMCFFKDFPAEWLVEAGVVTRCIDLLAAKEVVPPALKTIVSWDRRKIHILNDDVSLEALKLLYNVVLDSKYAAAAIVKADEQLTAIKHYLNDEVGFPIWRKGEIQDIKSIIL